MDGWKEGRCGSSSPPVLFVGGKDSSRSKVLRDVLVLALQRRSNVKSGQRRCSCVLLESIGIRIVGQGRRGRAANWLLLAWLVVSS